MGEVREVRFEQMTAEALRHLADKMGPLDVVDVVASMRLADKVVMSKGQCK